MAHAVFVSKPDSPYNDSEHEYHFPKQYLRRIENCVGDRIIYYGPVKALPGRYYFAVAKVLGIRPDPAKADHFYADMVEHLDFDEPVDYRAEGGFEAGLILDSGRPSGGKAINAVRPITPSEFSRIVDAGFPRGQDELDRVSQPLKPDPLQPPGMAEDPMPPLFVDRPIVSLLSDRKFRDAKFRQHVLAAYDKRCALTGLRLVNGGGRAEVEAAHIIPVERNGSDHVRNGLALSGTVHWMFDRGLLSLGEDFEILRSRHINYEIDHLLTKDLKAILPARKEQWPHQANLKWHREHVFKS